MKAKKKLFKLFTRLYSALLDSMIVAFCISIMTAWGKFKPAPSPWGAVVGSFPPNLNMKHYKSVEIFIKCSECEVHLCTCKAPYWKLSGYGSGSKPHILLRDRFRYVRFLRVWKSNRHVNREPTMWVVLLDVFCSCVRDFYGRGKQVATWSSNCALTSLCRYTYVQCVSLLSRVKKKQMWNLWKA